MSESCKNQLSMFLELALVLASSLVQILTMAGCSGTAYSSSSSGGGGGSGGSGGSGGGGGSSACSAMSTGQGASLNGVRPFTGANLWNTNISTAPVDPNSTAIINFIGPSIGLHPDFGAGQYQGSNIGIPYVVVNGAQALAKVNFTAYGNESDPGPMPIPSNAPIEGDPNPGTGDRHVLILDNSNCFLYELDSSYPNNDGSWNADSAAVWDLTEDEQRPWTWTSADAAGLPIFPGLVRYDEVSSGKIQHALRFTLQRSQAAFIPPASHWAANSSNALAAPMGMRLRLKANYDISQFSTNMQVILTAMKNYGLIMADNGSSMYISGVPDNRWDNNDLHNLSQVPASAFEVLQMTPLYTAANVPQGTARASPVSQPHQQWFPRAAPSSWRGMSVTPRISSSPLDWELFEGRAQVSLPRKPLPTRSTPPTSMDKPLRQ
jgi:hypothetical protein